MGRAIVRVARPVDRADALLVLPGFGYTRAGRRTFRRLSSTVSADGFDLFVPRYISRGGLDASRGNLERFIRQHQLERYERIHVFAFLAGAWTFNPLAEANALPNLKTIVYDRSPYQERAPRIALERLKFLTWVRYGSPVFDVARTPYVPLTSRAVRVALVIETTPTRFVRRFERTASSYGPYDFSRDAFKQRHDDCLYVPMNHDELYERFVELWAEIRTFIQTGRFANELHRVQRVAELDGKSGLVSRRMSSTSRRSAALRDAYFRLPSAPDRMSDIR